MSVVLRRQMPTIQTVQKAVAAVPAAAVAATVQLLEAIDIVMIEPTPPEECENFTSWLRLRLSRASIEVISATNSSQWALAIQSAEDCVKFPQVQCIDRIIMVPVPVPRMHQPSRAHGLQLFQLCCNDKNQLSTLYRRRLEWRTLRVLTE